MAGKSPSIKTGKVENVQKPFRFTNLPPEIGGIIYRLAVVSQSKSRWISDCYTLVPPAIAQVSKQIRTEVLPVFYGENSFRIDMDIDVLEYDEYGAPSNKTMVQSWKTFFECALAWLTLVDLVISKV